MALSPELEAIKDAWSKETGGGRDDAGTRALCDAYVAAHPEEFANLEALVAKAQAEGRDPIPDVVAALEVFRNAGYEEDQWRVEVFQLHKFLPQNIGGSYQPQIRIPGPGE